MSKYCVKFSTMDQVQSFIDDIRKVPYDVDAYHGNYIVDAKSILGILSLSFGREIELKLNSDDLAAHKMIQDICEEYK